MKQLLFNILFFTSISVLAQNTISPYSIFGPGEIQSGGFGTNKGMGGAGIALESGNYLNNLNPASYAGMDSLRIILDFGIEGKTYDISTSQESLNGFTGNLAYLAMGFKYTPWLAGSLGVVPFSSIGYSIDRVNYVEGTGQQYISNYSGSGGISRFYFSNAIKILKNLSLGVNASYMFGSLMQEENIESTDIVPQLQIIRQDFLKSMYFDYGIQYRFSDAKRIYSLGITYANKQNLGSEHIITVYDNSYSILRQETYDTDYLIIPEIIGLGIGITKNRKYSCAFDYTFQRWSEVDYPSQYDKFADSHKIAFGAEINPWEFRAINPFYKNWIYRFGISYESSYLKFDNTIISGKEITLGVGLPLYGGLSKVDFSFTGGLCGSTKNHLIQERYLLFNLGFSLNEIAFFKRPID